MDRRRTRAYIKQEAEDSKEYFKNILYSPPVKIETPSLKITERKSNTNKRHGHLCNITFAQRNIYLDHQLHSHNTKKTPIINLQTLCCNICDKIFTDRSSYRLHMANLNNIHIPLIRYRPKPDLSKTPDIKDPNHYCISCNYAYKIKDCYFTHLIKVHDMSLLGPPKEPDKAKNTHPTIDIVNLYCDACNRKYSIKSSYVRHLIYFHGVKLPDIYSERSNFDSKKLYCKVCDTKYANRDSFKKHLKTIHDVEPRSGPIPDINNPENYCITCDKTLHNRSSYLNHLCSFYLDEVPELYQGTDCPSPSKKDIKFKRYCADCRKVFPFNHIYQIHVDKIHGVDLIKCLENADDTDVNTSIIRCTLCDKKFSSGNIHKNHLVRFHYLRVPRKGFKSSDIVPVVNLLKRYCNVCDRTYATMKIYRTHGKKSS